ncbi:HTH_Tnp_Tc3_2 domain-containing protein [Trichonephila clavipes]|nr:HTH_Tnp_Tc3_2 domain-containing protein [Trichonephila clavipes]
MIARIVQLATSTSLASIQRHLPPSRHPVPSRETIRRRLTEVGLRSRRPLRRLPLTPHHKCRMPTSGNLECDRLETCHLRDESRFSLSADDHRTRVWRRTGQRSDPAFIVERHTAISQGAIYQQDNARPHTARLSQQCLQGYDVLPWPARTPDFSPIEHVLTAAVPRYLRKCKDYGRIFHRES